MTQVQVNGVSLCVKIDGSGPPIIALHGFAGNKSTWDDFVREAKHHYSVVTLDLLGHGESDSPSDPARYSIEQFTSDITTVLDRLGISRACWLGYSMGARIALFAATLKPNKFSSLILESASPGITALKERQARLTSDETWARLIEERGAEEFANLWEQNPLFHSQHSLPRQVQERIRIQRIRSNPVGLANTMRGLSLSAAPSLVNLLSSLQISVLCVTGELDEKFTTIAREMCGKLPNSRLSIIPDAGHAPHIEKPAEFNSVVMRFLDEGNS